MITKKPPFDFTRAKFLSLPKERQFKKLAILLHALYLKKMQGKPSEEFNVQFATYASWIGFEYSPLNTLKEISNLFHKAADLANLQLREYALLPNAKREDASIKKEPLPFFVYLDHLRSAHNVGSIIRTAECFGFSRVFFSKETPGPLSLKVQKSSMGTVDWIECLVDPPMNEVPRPLIILETVPEVPSIFSFDFPPSFTLVVGNEEYGVSDALLKEADSYMHIPLRGKKGTLNVANAFAVAAALITHRNSG